MMEINNLPIIALKYTARKLSAFFLVIFSMTYKDASVSRKKKTTMIQIL